MFQEPSTDSYLLRWKDDDLVVTLTLDAPRRGRAALRTNLGAASVRRREIIEETEQGATPLAKAWNDVPMTEIRPGVFQCQVPLDEVGIFSAKACFFPEGSEVPEWPAGSNFHVKVMPALTRRANAIYTVFTRQFGGARFANPEHAPGVAEAQRFLDGLGYNVIPPSGTFRDVARALGHIMDDMKFRIVQLLPVFPVPTTFARMGRYGCPFAATDFLSVDPAYAEFDDHATPLDQFGELSDAVHAKGGLLFLDLPANHTGWAATLQTHHPDWYHRAPDGAFISPGAWGVTWADLVELDYANPELRAYMADVFLFWCRHGVDGFRCDAGYMIPEATWTYIVARVREEYPDTVFMLEGLGGKLEVTDALLNRAGLDWAYSEIFQTYDRGGFDWYLPGAIERAEKYGALVHFAETHDNDRLAKGGAVYARLRVQLAALLSHQGAWGIANGVEWFATEKIDVHGASALNWGAADNMVPLIARLNTILATHPAFGPRCRERLVTRGDGNTLAVVRICPEAPVLVVANLDCHNAATVHWDVSVFDATRVTELVSGKPMSIDPAAGVWLEPGEVLCLAPAAAPMKGAAAGWYAGEKICGASSADSNGQPISYAGSDSANGLQSAAAESCPANGLQSAAAGKTRSSFPAYQSGAAPFTGAAPAVGWHWPADARRDVVVPLGCALRVSAPHAFRVRIVEGETTRAVERSAGTPVDLPLPAYTGDGTRCDVYALDIVVYAPDGVKRARARVLVPPRAEASRVKLAVSGAEVRADPTLRTVLSNGAGAMAFLPIAWGEIRSQYDAMFAANPKASVPGDRLVLWTRTRAWLQHEGYSREFNRDCLESFTADPAGRFAVWRFRIPCGMGRLAVFDFRLRLSQAGTNKAKLVVTRVSGGERDVAEPVRIVFRPDLEWRSFHATTKAQGPVEQAFGAPDALKPIRKDASSGFVFHPYGEGESLVFAVFNGACHFEPQWTYCVGHPDEAERGQEPCGDLYSPAWISCDFTVGGEAVLTAAYVSDRTVAAFDERQAQALHDERSATPEASTATLPVPDALARALDLFIVRRDDVKTVLAGYPWFLDWGRDTFIFLRGAIAAGKTDDALKIVMAFARFEENGTLPNIIYGETAGNRDTADAQLWFILAVRDLVAKLGRGILKTAVSCATPHVASSSRTLADVLESIVTHYVSGTPNGIRVDAESGLVWTPSHFTWMDTNYPACTPRHGYPVDIQAMWIAALRFLGGKWLALADRAAASLVKYFKSSEGLCDCLDAPNGESAGAARPDSAIRPNQLFVLTLDALPSSSQQSPNLPIPQSPNLPIPQSPNLPIPQSNNRTIAQSILSATERLLVPGGIRSLDAAHALYRGVYAGDEDTMRKPAYHNGTVWAWPFALYAEALVATGRASRETALSLLASSVDNLNAGCLCHMSEIADGDAPHAQKGCRAQAWSISEVLRVWLKLKG